MTLICHCCCHVSTGVEIGSPPVATAALLKNKSISPSSVSHVLTRAPTSSSLPTSQETAIAPMSSATARAPSTFTSATATFAPSSQNARAHAAPIPLAPPVTTTTRPCNSIIFFLLNEKANLADIAWFADARQVLRVTKSSESVCRLSNNMTATKFDGE